MGSSLTHIRTDTAADYSGKAAVMMAKSGLIKCDVYYCNHRKRTIQIAYFNDGTIIDGRKTNFNLLFHKKCYNE